VPEISHEYLFQDYEPKKNLDKQSLERLPPRKGSFLPEQSTDLNPTKLNKSALNKSEKYRYLNSSMQL